jgi:signal transduction histidine kinase
MAIDRGHREGEPSLLSAYQARYGASIRRQQSAVALRAARVEAELAYKARGTFLASMNHELRTPLNAITGFAGLLKEADTYGFAPEQKAEYLDHILQSAELLLSHIDMILQIADAESGGSKLSKRVIEVPDAVAEVREAARRDLDAAGARFVADVPRALPPIHADPDKLVTALRHLVAFALTRPREGMTVKLAVRPGLASRAGWVYFSLEDDGEGRTEAELLAALRVFEQVHEGLHRRFGSGALGLAVAKSFIELNGGRFNAKARPGSGHLFRFAVPVAEAQSQGADQQNERAAS